MLPNKSKYRRDRAVGKPLLVSIMLLFAIWAPPLMAQVVYQNVVIPPSPQSGSISVPGHTPGGPYYNIGTEEIGNIVRFVVSPGASGTIHLDFSATTSDTGQFVMAVFGQLFNDPSNACNDSAGSLVASTQKVQDFTATRNLPFCVYVGFRGSQPGGDTYTGGPYNLSYKIPVSAPMSQKVPSLPDFAAICMAVLLMLIAYRVKNMESK